MSHVLLVGTEVPLLEGLAQSFAALGFTPVTAESLDEARESALHDPPLVIVLSRSLAAAGGAETLRIPLAPGGALVLFRSIGSALVALSPSVQRSVMADLTLPLERNRLLALVQHVGDRATAAGRGRQSEAGDGEVTPGR
jgi:DNA-binding response OmpR family regulator